MRKLSEDEIYAAASLVRRVCDEVQPTLSGSTLSIFFGHGIWCLTCIKKLRPLTSDREAQSPDTREDNCAFVPRVNAVGTAEIGNIFGYCPNGFGTEDIARMNGS